MNVLGVQPATTGWNHNDGRRSTRREVSFEDWTIDGVPLRSLFASPGNPVQEMTMLAEPSATGSASLQRLLGQAPGDFADGRVALLVCPLDWDLACNTYSARVTFGEDWVGWSDFGWQVDYEPFEPTDELAPADARFEHAAYERLLNALLLKYTPH